MTMRVGNGVTLNIDKAWELMGARSVTANHTYGKILCFEGTKESVFPKLSLDEWRGVSRELRIIDLVELEGPGRCKAKYDLKFLATTHIQLSNPKEGVSQSVVNDHIVVTKRDHECKEDYDGKVFPVWKDMIKQMVLISFSLGLKGRVTIIPTNSKECYLLYILGFRVDQAAERAKEVEATIQNRLWRGISDAYQLFSGIELKPMVMLSDRALEVLSDLGKEHEGLLVAPEGE
ncbi:MAG: hypothetical protein S4CHLAM102_05540 [Chlamydiia bacterium]|nr:hypothetical protein [Chlamydiia bacterium]